jgi:hypothetical protein
VARKALVLHQAIVQRDFTAMEVPIDLIHQDWNVQLGTTAQMELEFRTSALKAIFPQQKATLMLRTVNHVLQVGTAVEKL